MAKTPSKSMTPHTEPIGARRKKRTRSESADAPKLAGDDTKRAKSKTTAPESAAKNGTINQYFTRAVRSKPADAQAPSRHTSVMNHHPTWSPSKENAVYVPLDISAICSGPGRVKFSGRISNVLEQDVRAQKAATASKLRYVLAVADGTGVIEVRLYLMDPKSLRVRPKLGGLVDIHATFVGPLSPQDKDKGTVSTGGVFISISDTDKDSNVEFVDDDDDNFADFRVPLGVNVMGELPGVIPLRLFLENDDEHPDAKVLVGIKWKGPRKLVHRKDNTSFEKRDIGIFDDSMEAILSLYGSIEDSTRMWHVSDTVLLIERPRLRIYQQIVEVRLGNTSLLTVDPQVRDAQYIRSYARRIIRKSNVCLPFPKEMFKVHDILGARGTLKYTLGDIDRFSRDAEMYSQRLGKCNGILNAVITEMNMNSLWQKNMLLCSFCCGVNLYSSKSPAICERCDQEHHDLLPNPAIIGRLSDQTGSVTGRNILISQDAWEKFLGVPVNELWKQDPGYFRQMDDHCLFLRLNFVFGWDSDTERIAILSIMDS